MLLEPQEAAPGAAKRWLQQSLELINRNFHTWMIFGALSSVVMKAVEPSLVGMCFVATIIALLGLVLAIASDRQQSATPGEVLGALKTCFPVAIVLARQRLIPLILVVVIGCALFGSISSVGDFFYMPQAADAETSSGMLDTISAFFAPLMLGLAFAVMTAMPGQSLPFRFLSIVLLKLDGLSAYRISVTGERKNRKLLATLAYVGIFIAVLAYVLCPFVAPFLLPVFCTMNYVAFREIFMGKGKNQEVRADVNVGAFKAA